MEPAGTIGTATAAACPPLADKTIAGIDGGQGKLIMPDRCLSVCQPWAFLIAAGYKSVENRTWQTDYRGIIAIHASTSGRYMSDDLDLWLQTLSPTLRSELWRSDAYYPFGAIVGLAEIVDCVWADDDPRSKAKIAKIAQSHGCKPIVPTEQWVAGEQYAWLMRRAVQFAQPIPTLGKLNLWKLSPEQQQQIAVAARALLPQGRAPTRPAMTG